MRRSHLLLLSCLLLLSSCSPDKWKAKRELQLGVANYKQAQYESAIVHFRRAIELDPGLTEATRYYASTASSLSGSGDSQYSTEAIAQFEHMLEDDPKQYEAVRGLALLHYQSAHMEDARKYWLRAIELKPSDPESFYSLAVIDFIQSYQPRMEKMAALGLKPDSSLISHRECGELKVKNFAHIQDGIERLGKAIDLRPDYADAFAYMNLMYRERANTRCKDPKAYEADMRMADEWVDRWYSLKKLQAERPLKQK